MKSHSGPAILRGSLAWASAQARERALPPRDGPLQASELAVYGYCPEAHRLEVQARTHTPATALSPMRRPAFMPSLVAEAPDVRYGREMHARVAEDLEEPNGAWTTRSLLVMFMLSATVYLVFKFG